MSHFCKTAHFLAGRVRVVSDAKQYVLGKPGNPRKLHEAAANRRCRIANHTQHTSNAAEPAAYMRNGVAKAPNDVVECAECRSCGIHKLSFNHLRRSRCRISNVIIGPCSISDFVRNPWTLRVFANASGQHPRRTPGLRRIIRKLREYRRHAAAKRRLELPIGSRRVPDAVRRVLEHGHHRIGKLRINSRTATGQRRTKLPVRHSRVPDTVRRIFEHGHRAVGSHVTKARLRRTHATKRRALAGPAAGVQ